MDECNEHFECHKRFDLLFEKLDKLDASIRGNGKPGILLRLDRLEQDAKRQSKLIWLIVGAGITVAATVITTLLIG